MFSVRRFKADPERTGSLKTGSRHSFERNTPRFPESPWICRRGPISWIHHHPRTLARPLRWPLPRFPASRRARPLRALPLAERALASVAQPASCSTVPASERARSRELRAHPVPPILCFLLLRVFYRSRGVARRCEASFLRLISRAGASDARVRLEGLGAYPYRIGVQRSLQQTNT